MKKRVDPALVYTIAGAASADPSTVRKFLAGEVLRPMVANRIEDALNRLGYENPRPSRKGAKAAA